MMNGAGIAWIALATWGQAAPTPAPSPEPRYYLIQVRIIEVDEQGQQTVVATPTLQTTGDATGVTVDPKRGRKFEFHFNAINPLAPATSVKAATEDSPSSKPLVFADGAKVEKPAASRVSVKAVQQSRKEILKAIADQAGLHLVLDADTVAATAAPLLMPISLELLDTPVEDAIRQITEPAQLKFAVRQDLVLIGASPMASASTAAPAAVKASLPNAVPPSPLPGNTSASPMKAPTEATTLSVRVYAVQDLVDINIATGRPVFNPLVERVHQIAAGEPWDTQGGMATIRGFDSTVSLVVRQTPAGHEAVAKTLMELRAAISAP